MKRYISNTRIVIGIFSNIILWTAVSLAALGNYFLSHYSHERFFLTFGIGCCLVGIIFGFEGILMFIIASLERFEGGKP